MTDYRTSRPDPYNLTDDQKRSLSMEDAIAIVERRWDGTFHGVQDAHAAIDDDDESYTWEREPVQPFRYIDDDRGMIIAAYVTIAACAFIAGMVAMRLLTWWWA